MTETSQCIYTLIYPFNGPATNHCPENGLSHLRIMKCPNVHIISPQLVTHSFLRKWVFTHSYWALPKNTVTGWLILYHLEPGHATTSKLISICQQLFQVYGAPEELSTDGGPPFTSSSFQEFLKMWCVNHRLSSIAYPQSNGQAELMVKTAKRIVNGNTDSHGSLDNDNVAQAILLYQNTPI